MLVTGITTEEGTLESELVGESLLVEEVVLAEELGSMEELTLVEEPVLVEEPISVGMEESTSVVKMVVSVCFETEKSTEKHKMI